MGCLGSARFATSSSSSSRTVTRVVVARSEFDLRKAKEREHILEGLKIAVNNIDEVIRIIRGSLDAEAAGVALRERFSLSEAQTEAILNMRLARLTALEMGKLEEELMEVRAEIGRLQELLASRELRMKVISDELQDLSDKYGDDRRTSINRDSSDLGDEDLIADEEMVLTVSHHGYVKRMPVDTYRAQRRGGRGLQGMGTKEEDWVEQIFTARTKDYLMIFTGDGMCHWVKVWQVPLGSRQARGKPIVNLLNIDADSKIAAVVPVREFADDRYLLFCTLKGVVKKTALSAYGNVRTVGLNAMNIREGDELIDVQITGGFDEIILATRDGFAIRFEESDTRPMGRATEGVRGISLRGDDLVVGMVVVRAGASLLVVTEGGMGKRTEVDAYRLQKRGGMGVINMKLTAKTGKVVSIKSVAPGEQLMLITKNGVVNRQRADEIRIIGRATQGVRLVSLDPEDAIMDVARVVAEEGGEGEAEEDEPVADATVNDASVSAEQEG